MLPLSLIEIGKEGKEGKMATEPRDLSSSDCGVDGEDEEVQVLTLDAQEKLNDWVTKVQAAEQLKMKKECSEQDDVLHGEAAATANAAYIVDQSVAELGREHYVSAQIHNGLKKLTNERLEMYKIRPTELSEDESGLQMRRILQLAWRRHRQQLFQFAAQAFAFQAENADRP